MGKLEKMIQHTPSIYQAGSNVNIRALLKSWGDEDDQVVSQITAAKNQLFVKTAFSRYLDSLGANVGVFRNPDFQLVDDTFRKLIPLLSFTPKQVKPTIQAVLDVFFGEGNSSVEEVNPSEIVVIIPSSVPGVKELKGAWHLNSYGGQIVSVDNVFKIITIDFTDQTQLISGDVAKGGKFCQGIIEKTIVSHDAGVSGVQIQFDASVDLSDIDASGDFNLIVPRYYGSYIPDKTASYTVRSYRGVLGQDLSAGGSTNFLSMQDASWIPNSVGKIILNFGKQNQEGPIDYYSRPNDFSIFIDPTYNFLNDHLDGDIVNVVSAPYTEPNIDGSDYSAYLAGVTSSVDLAQFIVRSIVAAGVVVRFILQ